MGRLRYPYRQGSRFPARRPDHYTLDPYLVLDIPFHEGSGSLVEDRSIHKNTGTISDGTWKAQGIRGACLEFDGEDDYVDCGNDASLKLTVWTLECWIYRKVDSFAYERLISKSDASKQDYFINITSDEVFRSAFLDTGETTRAVETTKECSLVTWYHFLATFDGTYIRIYINGALEATSDDFSAYTPRTSNRSLLLGLAISEYNFNGPIDLARILDRALSAQEALDRYERTKR